jgi:hypothetical protein
VEQLHLAPRSLMLHELLWLLALPVLFDFNEILTIRAFFFGLMVEGLPVLGSG